MKKLNSDAVKIIPLGGLEQIGMNITAIEYEDSIIVIVRVFLKVSDIRYYKIDS